uniref:deleted in malignant brain tumors 1 protein-like isoform X1 n=1 Tax=Styela clava TaxID=7725 RepID=UPI00193A6D28|nr:deleted in malignant brain tumors 1 protein-like isoform X1 [Styela clava]
MNFDNGNDSNVLPVENEYETNIMDTDDTSNYQQETMNQNRTKPLSPLGCEVKKKKRFICVFTIFLLVDILITAICLVFVMQGKAGENNEARADYAAYTNISELRNELPSEWRNISDTKLLNKIERISHKIDHKRKVRLAGGKTEKEGRVEILYMGEWGTVCDDTWGTNEAQVICEMLDFSEALEAPTNARFGPGRGRIWLDQVNCGGIETSIGDCLHESWGHHNCRHDEDASVICE